MTNTQRIRVIDTHTGGEPTRVVMAGGPDLGAGTMAERRELFSKRYDDWRRAITCEPRGSECMVGALITPPENSNSLCGVIFFNNVGYLGMCGHGTIGVAVALAHAGRAGLGRHYIDTAVARWFSSCSMTTTCAYKTFQATVIESKFPSNCLGTLMARLCMSEAISLGVVTGFIW